MCITLQYNTPPSGKTDTHERPRRTKAAMEQMVRKS